MKVLTIRIDDELYEKLRWVAFKEHCSQNSIVVKLLEKEMKNIKLPKEIRDD
ncbi:hypothetical protein J7L05_00835 [bacterium]|nr:hypothetical protein [bacterium]